MRDDTYKRIQRAWNNMRHRCYYKTDKSYNNYGARGISVCDEWKTSFRSFYEWALANGYTDKLTLDRIDNDKGYSPDNCRWTTWKVQENNKNNCVIITFQGKTQTRSQWADELGLDYFLIRERIDRMGWDIEKALTTPARPTLKRSKK